MKIAELNAQDCILGLDTYSNICWEEVPTPPRVVSNGSFKRVLTEVSELLLPEESKVGILGDVKSVADLTLDDRIEIFDREDGFRLVFEHLSNRKLSKARCMNERKVELNHAVAYVLGTQILCKRYENKVVMSIRNEKRWKELAGIFKEALDKSGFYGEVYYATRLGSRALINSIGFTRFVNEFLSDEARVPHEIRCSRAEVLLEFFRGIFDSTLCTAGKGIARLSTASIQDEIRRFVFNIAKLLRIVPYDIKVLSPTDSRRRIWISFRNSDLADLDLRNIETTYSQTRSIPETRKDYAPVKRIDTFRKKDVYFLPSRSTHWTPVVDLALVHHR